MRTERQNAGKIEAKSRGLGTVTPEMVKKRARELAIINGRSPNHLIEADWAEAKRELQGLDAPSSVEDDAEAISSQRPWDPVPGTSGHRVATEGPVDEQVLSERLVEEGVNEAEHDQMLEHTKESLRRDRGR